MTDSPHPAVDGPNGVHISVLMPHEATLEQKLSDHSLDSISFHATGGIKAKGVLLTRQGDAWTARTPIYRVDNSPIQYTAIYPPVLSEPTLTLYHNNRLTDYLIAQGTLTTGSQICLAFHHMFARLCIRLADTTGSAIEQANVKTPFRLTRLNQDGQCMKAESPVEQPLDPNELGEWQGLIPMGEGIALTLTLRIAGKAQILELPATTYRPGHTYTYVIKKEGAKGIRTTQDWDIVRQLIDGAKMIKDKTLADYQNDTPNGKVIYLLNDLDWRGEDNPFRPMDLLSYDGTIDGNNHTIANYRASDPALFYLVGPKAKVKNVRVDGCNGRGKVGKISVNKQNLGVIADENQGVIDHCIVINANLDYKDGSKMPGAITGNNKGTIMNCGVENSYVKGAVNCGGIVGINRNKIINCYVTHLTLNGIKTTTGIGGIAGEMSRNGQIENVYCQALTLQGRGKKGIVTGVRDDDTQIGYAYYPTDDPHTLSGDKKTRGITNTWAVTGSGYLTKGGKPIVDALNEWVKTHSAKVHVLTWKSCEANLWATFEP